jgi:signal transduction histidine kinase
LGGGITLITAPNAPPITAELDRSLMLRAMSNLVSNAIVHTPPGGTVTLAAAADGEALRIEVADTGTGIPVEALPRVFDRFFRVDPSRSKASGGTGLGLAIVQSIMTLHGGTAEIASELGRGTTVTLRVHTAAKR